jgi:hypothetical protein
MIQDLLRLTQEDASCRSKLHSSFGAEQQFNAKLLFQVEDSLADCGLRHVQAAGRFAVVQMMSDANEVTQMAKLHNFMLIAESDYYKQIIRFPRLPQRCEIRGNQTKGIK